jgi:hypothetical protein
MTAQTVKLNAKIFLEGIEIPFNSFTVTENCFSVPVAQINIPPSIEAQDIKPRTLCHIFYSMGDDKNYYLMFEGECYVSGDNRTSTGRSASLVAFGISNYFATTSVVPNQSTSCKTMEKEAVFNSQAVSSAPVGDAMKDWFYKHIKDEEDDRPPIHSAVKYILSQMGKYNRFFFMQDLKYDFENRIYYHENDNIMDFFIEYGMKVIADENMTEIWGRKKTKMSLADVVRQMLFEVFFDLSFRGDTIVNTIIKPTLYFHAPPACNIFFPEFFDQYSCNIDYINEHTRSYIVDPNPEMYGDAPDPSLWVMQLFGTPEAPTNTQYVFITPSDVRKGIAKRMKDTLAKRGTGAVQETAEGEVAGYTMADLNNSFRGMFTELSEEEKFRGVVPSIFTYSGIVKRYSSSFSGMVRDEAIKVGLVQGATKDQIYNAYMEIYSDYKYYLEKYRQRTLTISGRFNPFPVCGYPIMLLDKDAFYYAYLVSKTTTVSADGTAASTFMCRFPRAPQKMNESLFGEAQQNDEKFATDELIDEVNGSGGGGGIGTEDSRVESSGLLGGTRDRLTSVYNNASESVDRLATVMASAHRRGELLKSLEEKLSVRLPPWVCPEQWGIQGYKSVWGMDKLRNSYGRVINPDQRTKGSTIEMPLAGDSVTGVSDLYSLYPLTEYEICERIFSEYLKKKDEGSHFEFMAEFYSHKYRITLEALVNRYRGSLSNRDGSNYSKMFFNGEVFTGVTRRYNDKIADVDGGGDNDRSIVRNILSGEPLIEEAIEDMTAFINNAGTAKDAGKYTGGTIGYVHNVRRAYVDKYVTSMQPSMLG